MKQKDGTLAAHEYRDGIQSVRCRACGRAIRDAADGPVVPIRIADLERIVVALRGVRGTREIRARLAQAVGQSVKQINARRALEG